MDPFTEKELLEAIKSISNSLKKMNENLMEISDSIRKNTSEE